EAETIFFQSVPLFLWVANWAKRRTSISHKPIASNARSVAKPWFRLPYDNEATPANLFAQIAVPLHDKSEQARHLYDHTNVCVGVAADASDPRVEIRAECHRAAGHRSRDRGTCLFD